MLNSIIKFAIFIGIVGALAVGVNYLLTAPEGDGVVITFREQEWTLRPLMFAGLVLGGFAALWLALKVTGIGIAVFNFIMGDETAFSRYFERNRERKGTEALAGAHAAIVSGDLRRAKQKAQRAERMLQRPELTRLTMAQTAELAGEPVRAKTYYKALSDNPETALVGVKGLLRIAESEGDRDTALILARTAAGLKADDKETLETLYTLQSQAFDWEGARVTLGSLKRAGQIA
ncbi:MAG: heme biosynthesis HemY N-terminal domain-containing protein, partial [Pseudomonadota bacterium]